MKTSMSSLPPGICFWHVYLWEKSKRESFPGWAEHGVLTACYHPTCQQFWLAGLQLPSCSIVPPKGGQECLTGGGGHFSKVSRAGGAYSLLSPNLSRVWIGRPWTAFLHHLFPKGRPVCLASPPPKKPFASGVMGGGGGCLSQGEQSRGCLQPVVTQPVWGLDWLALNCLSAPSVPWKGGWGCWRREEDVSVQIELCLPNDNRVTFSSS